MRTEEKRAMRTECREARNQARHERAYPYLLAAPIRHFEWSTCVMNLKKSLPS